MATHGAHLSLELNAESVTAAVNAYIWYKVKQLGKLKKYDPKTRDAVRHYLSSRADDTFLWVALVCHALEDPAVRKRHSLEKVREFPTGLDSLYTKATNDIRRSKDADLCRHILAVTTSVRRPLSLQELVSLVEELDDFSEDIESLEEIIDICGSFLSIRRGTVYFVHQSAKDFLLGDISDRKASEASQQTFSWVFPSGKETEHCQILSKSLNVMSGTLKRDMYGLRSPGFPIDQVSVPTPDPLAAIRYSCVYWADHLHDWQLGDNIKHPDIFQDGGIIDNFLRKHYLHWLEALSLCRSMSQGILSMTKLDSILQVSST